MRLRDDSQNRQSARHQREQCAACLDTLAYETDAIGRVFAFCPHCRDGRPHSRAQHLARLAEEDAACRQPFGEDARRCAWCDGPYTPENHGQRYCGMSCRDAMTNHRANARNRARREARANGTPLPKALALVPRPTHCGVCGVPLVQRAHGQPRRYCSTTCRNRACRGPRTQPGYLEALRRRWQAKSLATPEPCT